MNNSWNGTYKGKECQDGTYTWKLRFAMKDSTGATQVLTGHVNLLK